MPRLLRQLTVPATWAVLGLCGLPAADSLPPAQLDQAFGGTWEFSLHGASAGAQGTGELPQTLRVHFLHGQFDGNPLGRDGQGFQLRSYKLGGATAFDWPYLSSTGAQAALAFTGTLSKDGNQLAGKFTSALATGTFTAVREACVPDQPTLAVALGESGELHLHLTLKPDADVTIRASRLHGDQHLTVDTGDLVFTPDNWDREQTAEIDAATVGATGKAAILVSGDGVPDTTVPIRLVQARSENP